MPATLPSKPSRRNEIAAPRRHLGSEGFFYARARVAGFLIVSRRPIWDTLKPAGSEAYPTCSLSDVRARGLLERPALALELSLSVAHRSEFADGRVRRPKPPIPTRGRFPKRSLAGLSLYLRELQHLVRDGKETTSSTQLGSLPGLHRRPSPQGSGLLRPIRLSRHRLPLRRVDPGHQTDPRHQPPLAAGAGWPRQPGTGPSRLPRLRPPRLPDRGGLRRRSAKNGAVIDGVAVYSLDACPTSQPNIDIKLGDARRPCRTPPNAWPMPSSPPALKAF